MQSLLDAAARHPAVLVCAPAGCGKTTSVTAWARRHAGPGRVAWVDCAGVSDTPAGFWDAFVGAVSSVTDVPDQGRIRYASLSDRRDTLAQLVAWLQRLPEGTVVVCDDFHHVTSAQTQDDLQYVLERLPGAVRVVLVTRTLPQLALHRARVDGRLGELRVDDLAFTPAETAHLLSANGLTLPAAAVDRLQQQTQGWAAGLRLAILAMLHSSDPVHVVDQLTTSTEAVSGYLTEQVLARLDIEDREFLWDTCVVDSIGASLAEALTGRHEAAADLRRVADRVGFLTPSHDRDGTYRYHPMFAEIVRNQLHYTDPDRYARQHRRAAAWHSRHGAVIALRHAVAARDWDLVGELLAANLLILTNGGAFAQVAEILAETPPEVRATDPRLQLASVVILLLTDHAEQARPILEEVAARLPTGSSLEERRFRTTHAVVQALAARYVGDAAAILRALPHDAPEVPSPGTAGFRPQDLALHVSWRSHRATGLMWDDQVGPAGVLARSVLREVADRAAAWHTVGVLGTLSLIDATSGRLARADDEISEAATVLHLRSWSAAPYLALADLAEAWAAVERCEVDRATEAVDRAARRWSELHAGFPGVLVPLVRARLAVTADGDLRRARALLAESDERRQVVTSRFLDRLRSVVGVEAALAAGDLDRAGMEAAAGPAELRAWVAARRMLQTGADLDPGEGVPAPVSAEAADGSANQAALRVRVLATTAVVAHRQGDTRAADRLLDQALDLTDAEGFRLPFVQLGSGLHQVLLTSPVSTTRHGATVASLLAVTTPTRPDSHADYVEALTAREVEVLQHLVAGLDAGEIAERLFLSRNTVRTHLKNIYRKLAANSRREAILRASALDLI